MFVLTLKLPRLRFWAGTAAALCLFAATVPLPLAGPETVPAAAVQTTGKLRTNGERVAFLRALGWEVSAEPLSAETLLVPPELPESSYLALLREQGFDPETLAGRRVKRFLYAVEAPGAPDARAELLILQGRLVGGSSYSAAPEGFSGPLSPPQ